MNRIEERFEQLRARRQKGMIIYIGAGDPDLETTRRLALAFDQAGVDVLELGVPFSDPLADGIVNQLAAQRGLAAGATPRKVIDTVRSIRAHSEIPIVLYLYSNLLFRRGLHEFIQDAAAAGVDGFLVLDLPPEEAGDYGTWMRQAGLCPISLVAPTTPETRIARIVQNAGGFIYCVSREGVTGMQDRLAADLAGQVARIRRHTALPIAVGFGISNPDQARAAAAEADAAVVGSAIVSHIARLGRHPDLVGQIASQVGAFVHAVKTLPPPLEAANPSLSGPFHK